ncbi:hypothetical protein [Pedobacter caeni]|uniref:Uncharacterized protein n=1 Tax=Pedobacter caeni TaxID=288992 RepID=A0A1M5NCE5_9SPHI|nr:hypothetical protein [Pedobacter caeni]SHG87142.1 hypothetical protein SAMN04488522_10881 [Pedobacter caeni]
MKKMFLLIFFIFIIIFGIDRLTVINLSPKLLFKRSEYKQFPELNDGLQSAKFSLYRATQTSKANIRYFPQKNFFLISNFKRNGHFNPIKIDSAGNNVFELNIDEKHHLKFLEAINCFLIESDSIYDLSADNPVAIPFTEVLNRDRNIEPERWVQIFEKLYQSSDIVLYGWHTDIQTTECIYFRTEGKWTKLYTFGSKGPMYIYSEGSEIKCKINKKEIPHKWHEEHYLKDVEKATYSNVHRYTDEYITPYNSDLSFFPDQALKYQPAGTLKTLAFSKEKYTDDGYLNPGIPSAFYGTSYYALNLDQDILHFKTRAYKHNGIGENVQTDMFLFDLPLAFVKRSAVSFLTYDYSTNFHENDKKGIYIIKKK